MAQLKEDHTILFETVSEFLDQFDSHISKGGFYLESEVEWELRAPTSFKVRIAGTDAATGITAEVVHCAQGKVGLQAAPESETVSILRELAEQLRGGPVLTDDGVIAYASIAAFLADFEANVASGGFYLQSDKEWPKGDNLDFVLHVEGHEPDLPLRAEPMLVGGGMVSLKIEYTKANVKAINDLVIRLRKELKLKTNPPPEPDSKPPEKVPSGPGFQSFQGVAVASRDPKEFEPVRPVELKGNEVTTTMFTLMASLSRLGAPASLLVESNGDRMVFQFDAQGKLVEFHADRSEQDFLERMARAQFLDRDLQDELRKMIGEGKTAAEMVLERKVASDKQVFIIFRDQIIDALEKARSVGQIRFLVDPNPTGHETGILFEQLILPWMERALKAMEAKQIKTMLKPIWDKAPRLSRSPTWTLNQLGMDDNAYHFAQSLDGSLPLKRSITAVAKEQRDKTLRLVISLYTLGTLEVVQAEGADAPQPSAAAPAASQETAEESPVTQLAEELKELEEGNAFDQAGVHWSAHPNMYPEAMQEMHKLYGPSSDLARLSPQAGQLCRRRLELAKLAMVEIKTASKRQFHREALVPMGMRKQSAKLMFQKAEQHIAKQKLPEALEYLEMAYELDPQPEYRTRLENIRPRVKQ